MKTGKAKPMEVPVDAGAFYRKAESRKQKAEMKMKTKSKTKTKAKAKARVNHISISRLYSLGNYEHVKYEIGAEVPEGASARDALLDLAAIIQRMKPVKKPYDFDRAIEVMNKTPEATSEAEKANLEHYREVVSSYSAAVALRTAALAKLDDLGGTSRLGGGKSDDFDDDTPY